MSNFERLLNLKDGWYNGEGKAPTPKLISLVKDIILGINIPSPHVFPVFDGGILVEWDLDARDVHIEFEADGTVRVMGHDKINNEWLEEEFTLTTPYLISALSSLLTQFIAEAVQ